MTDLECRLQDYLRLRRALGFKLKFPGQVLPQFLAYLDTAGASTITTELAIRWTCLAVGVAPISLAHRLGAVREFARYMATLDPATEVPPFGIWPSTARRPTPYLWSDTEIRALLDAAARIRSPLRAATHETFFGLLAATGMRVSEAINLARNDIDLTGGVITIRNTKYGRSRLVPLHPTVTSALRSYLTRRDELCPKPRTASFFVSSTGTALGYAGVRKTFIELTTTIRLRTATVRPRIHDIRHSFAVRCLINWHKSGTCIDGRIVVLSNYLGHVNPAGTYWYLSASPELMELAATRLNASLVRP
jgi:integrase/recombinase XerD